VTEITDEFMHTQLPQSRHYSLVILRHGPRYGSAGADAIIWEHGRRNFALRAEGKLDIVCPISDGGDIAGIGIFSLSIAQAEELMDADPAVEAGVLSYEVHEARGFPGDALRA
jgi:hypothetical protein